MQELHGVALCLLASAAVIGCAGARQPAAPADDARITSRVWARLAVDPELEECRLRVATDQGVVRLSGAVGALRQRERAERLVHQSGLAWKVINEIEVTGERPAAPAATGTPGAGSGGR